MAYTSGRTVKSNTARPTTVAKATADARKLINRHLPDAPGVFVSTTRTAHPVTLAAELRTVITWPGDATDAHTALAAAVTELPGYLGAMNDNSSITFLRTA